MRNMKCLNCNIYGHSFQYCNKPIKSFGIIAYRYKYNKLEYILIQRKDTIGYTDFLRGRYKNTNLISTIEEMTNKERYNIIHNDFDTLWDNLWHNHMRGIYINEKSHAKAKFYSTNIKEILSKIEPSKYDEPEYGFPKGRKNLHEKYEECAKREFEEETGFNSCDYQIDENIDPLTETFVGSDGKKYSHVYYVAKVNPFLNIKNNKKTDVFLEEISQIIFADFKQAYKKIRSYDTQKRYTLYKTNKLLRKKLKLDA
jgi:8-oxo-dGTP pyrophosphatase MutT (NUDIX family)